MTRNTATMGGKALQSLMWFAALLSICHECRGEEDCPTWMVHDSSPQRNCVCADRLQNVIQCYDGSKGTYIHRYFCMFYSEEKNTTLVGTCPYSDGHMVSANLTEFKSSSKQCRRLHRKGQLCGECEDNYTIPVYSYNIGCVQCKDYKHGWIKFIAVAFLPLTAFYVLVITFRISATSSSLNGYVLVCHILATPQLIRSLYAHNQINPYYYVSYATQLGVKSLIAIYTFWDLDFFRSFYNPICLHPNLTYPQVLLLDYAIAVYPMFLILVTFVFVKLHDNYALVTKLWMPFHRCLVLFRKQWNIRSSLVNALATFFILSYDKILNVSFELLTPSHVYNMEGKTVNVAYMYFNGSITMTSNAYRPYLVIAIFMLLAFNIFPLLFIALYPFHCFQRLLSICGNQRKVALQILMDSFHGCYKHTSRHYQHFATLYLVVRFLNLLMSTIFIRSKYLPSTSLLLVFTVVLVARFRPYKDERSNTVDIINFLALIVMYTLGSILSGVAVVNRVVPRLVNKMILSTTSVIPPIVVSILVLKLLFSKAVTYLVGYKTRLMERINDFREKTTCTFEEQANLSHRSVNYYS